MRGVSDYETVGSLEKIADEYEAKQQERENYWIKKKTPPISNPDLPSEYKSEEFFSDLNPDDILSVKTSDYWLASEPPQLSFQVTTKTGVYHNLLSIVSILHIKPLQPHLPEEFKEQYKRYKDFPLPRKQEKDNKHGDLFVSGNIRKLRDRDHKEARKKLLDAINQLSDEHLVQSSVIDIGNDTREVTIDTTTQHRVFLFTLEEFQTIQDRLATKQSSI